MSDPETTSKEVVIRGYVEMWRLFSGRGGNITSFEVGHFLVIKKQSLAGDLKLSVINA